jgi:hypothetical protein
MLNVSDLCCAVPHNNHDTLLLENFNLYLKTKTGVPFVFLPAFLFFIVPVFSFSSSYALFHTFVSEHGCTPSQCFL